jgi:hypothetical protein
MWMYPELRSETWPASIDNSDSWLINRSWEPTGSVYLPVTIQATINVDVTTVPDEIRSEYAQDRARDAIVLMREYCAPPLPN